MGLCQSCQKGPKAVNNQSSTVINVVAAKLGSRAAARLNALGMAESSEVARLQGIMLLRGKARKSRSCKEPLVN